MSGDIPPSDFTLSRTERVFMPLLELYLRSPKNAATSMSYVGKCKSKLINLNALKDYGVDEIIVENLSKIKVNTKLDSSKTIEFWQHIDNPVNMDNFSYNDRESTFEIEKTLFMMNMGIFKGGYSSLLEDAFFEAFKNDQYPKWGKILVVDYRNKTKSQINVLMKHFKAVGDGKYLSLPSDAIIESLGICVLFDTNITIPSTEYCSIVKKQFINIAMVLIKPSANSVNQFVVPNCRDDIAIIGITNKTINQRMMMLIAAEKCQNVIENNKIIVREDGISLRNNIGNINEHDGGPYKFISHDEKKQFYYRMSYIDI